MLRHTKLRKPVVEPSVFDDEKKIPVIRLSSDHKPSAMEVGHIDNALSELTEQISSTRETKNRVRLDGEQLRLL